MKQFIPKEAYLQERANLIVLKSMYTERIQLIEKIIEDIDKKISPGEEENASKEM